VHRNETWLVVQSKFKDMTVLRVDFDTQQSEVRGFRAQARSTLIVFKGTKDVTRSVGETKRDALAALLNKAICGPALAALGVVLLAGILSTLSPCFVPILPVVLRAAGSEHRYGRAAFAAGLASSFVVLGLFVATIGLSIGLDEGVFRAAAPMLMIAIGAALLLLGFSGPARACRGACSELDRTEIQRLHEVATPPATTSADRQRLGGPSMQRSSGTHQRSGTRTIRRSAGRHGAAKV
jgi:hypothetical protein